MRGRNLAISTSMSMFSKSIWPKSVKSPYRRLALGVALAPLAITALLSGVAFLLAGMSEETGTSVTSVTLNAAQAFMTLVYGFTVTFGLAGVLALWAMGMASLMTWIFCGFLTGGLAGLVFSQLTAGAIQPTIVMAFALGASLLMMLIRAIAGIQDEPT